MKLLVRLKMQQWNQLRNGQSAKCCVHTPKSPKQGKKPANDVVRDANTAPIYPMWKHPRCKICLHGHKNAIPTRRFDRLLRIL